MTRIRRLSCLDIPKISKMIEYLDNNENIKFTDDLRNEAFTMLHTMLPLKYKFLPESYVLSDNKEILGLITVVPTMGNPYKINISRLIFGNNYYDAGKQLVEFVIARYGSKGATSFALLLMNRMTNFSNCFHRGADSDIAPVNVCGKLKILTLKIYILHRSGRVRILMQNRLAVCLTVN